MALTDIKKRAARVCRRVLGGVAELLSLDGPEQDVSGVIKAPHAELHYSPTRLELQTEGTLARLKVRGLYHYHCDQGREIQALTRDGWLETYTYYRRPEASGSFVCWYQQVRINRRTGEVSYRENEASYEWKVA